MLAGGETSAPWVGTPFSIDPLRCRRRCSARGGLRRLPLTSENSLHWCHGCERPMCRRPSCPDPKSPTFETYVPAKGRKSLHDRDDSTGRTLHRVRFPPNGPTAVIPLSSTSKKLFLSEDVHYHSFANRKKIFFFFSFPFALSVRLVRASVVR